MASRESAMAVLLVVLSGQLCCGEVQETDAAAKGSRHNAVLRRNPIKRHAVDKSSMRQKRAVWRVFVSRIEWRKTGNACIGNCEGLPDGNYQSCVGCNVHATCSNKKMSDRAPCSHSLVWDDGSKQCQNTSSTCKLLIGYSACRKSPCKNGADCKSKVAGGKEHLCTCKEGYAGASCEDVIPVSPGLSTQTKVAVGVGVGTVVAGTAAAVTYAMLHGAATTGQTTVSQGVHAPDVAAGVMSALLSHRRKEDSEDVDDKDGAEKETDSFPSWLTSWWTW